MQNQLRSLEVEVRPVWQQQHQLRNLEVEVRPVWQHQHQLRNLCQRLPVLRAQLQEGGWSDRQIRLRWIVTCQAIGLRFVQGEAVHDNEAARFPHGQRTR